MLFSSAELGNCWQQLSEEKNYKTSFINLDTPY